MRMTHRHWFLMIAIAMLSTLAVGAPCDRWLSSAKQLYSEWISQPASSVWKSLSDYSYQARLSVVQRMSDASRSHASHMKLAGLIDDGVLKGHISVADADQLIRKINDQEVWNYFRSPKGKIVVGKTRKADVEAIVRPLIRRSKLSMEDMIGYNVLFYNEIPLTYREIQFLLSPFEKLPSGDEAITRLSNYIRYADSFTKSEKLDALADASKLFSEESAGSKYVDEFKNLETKFDKYELKQREKVSEPEAKVRREKYERLTLGCKARGPTPERQRASGNFRNVALGFSLTSAVGSYTVTHWKQKKDSEWFLNIGFDVTTSLIHRYVSTKIQLSPQSGYLKKMMNSVGMGAIVDAGSSVGYSALFDKSDAYFNEELKKLESSPTLKQELDDLTRYLDSDPEVQAFVKKINEAQSEEELAHLFTAGVTSDENIHDEFIKAMSEKAYDQMEGNHIKSGDKGIDRYLFHRLWSLYSAPRSLLMGILTYKILCMGQMTPVMATTQAVLLMAADQIANNFLYYSLRKNMIGQ